MCTLNECIELIDQPSRKPDIVAIKIMGLSGVEVSQRQQSIDLTDCLARKYWETLVIGGFKHLLYFPFHL